MTVDHPAKFSAAILAKMEEHLEPVTGTLLDPFAGVGKIHELAREDLETVGVELEAKWAAAHPRTIVGNALSLPFDDESVDAVATSCTYGNRMSDLYDGRDGSKRYTYRIALGEELSPENSGGLQWGDAYREFHQRAWKESVRVLKTGGLFVLNISDHIRKGRRQHVSDFHVRTLLLNGLSFERADTVMTSRNRNGANHEARVVGEQVISFRKR